jgi:hypothetical protein
MKYLVAGLFAPLFVVLVLAVPLWLTRLFAPRLESYLFGPLYNVGYLIGCTARRLGQAIRHLFS